MQAFVRDCNPGISRAGRLALRMVLAFGLLLPVSGAGNPAEAQARRKQYLQEILELYSPTWSDIARTGGRVSAVDKSWEDRVRRTGELPPDFASMPANAKLPDPLTTIEHDRNVKVTTLAQWEKQRKWIRAQAEYWIYGKMPPRPNNLRAVVTGEHREGTATIRDVRLEFGPEHRGTLRVQLIIPDGKGPFPVFLTNHARNRPWLYTAVRRGYIACVYFGVDPFYGNGDDSDKFIELYPDYDFATIARWAWSAMRAVDYLYTVPEVDKTKIGITGHSRGGVQALAAAAFDERIGAVIPSSGNTGECNPWRYVSAIYPSESLAGLTTATAHWFQPRLRFFIGRENLLPIDQNMILSLVAPRGLMMYSAYTEHAGNPVGFEQSYRSVREVYRFLGHEENVWLNLRPGEHATTAADVENFIDFFDTVFKRKSYPRSETWINGFTFAGWQKTTGQTVDPLRYRLHSKGDYLLGRDGKKIDSAAKWAEKKKEIRKAIEWALGEEPAGLPYLVHHKITERNFSSDGVMLARLFNRPRNDPEHGFATIPFGEGLSGDLYCPTGADGKLKPGKWPAVIFLHPYSYAQGYSRYSRPTITALNRRGYAVFAFDQIGFGTRVLDAKPFYTRYPKWSLMGKMVNDTHSAVDALAALENIDASRIYIVGYALGAKVGLLTAALDDRVMGVVAACGFRPLRLSTPEDGTEGIWQYSHLHGLMPRLGFFIKNERRLPIDDDEIVALIAPRPVRIVAPAMDRYNPVKDVRQGVDQARMAYALLGHPDALSLDTPLDFDEFSRSTRARSQIQDQAFDWLFQVH